MCAKVRCALHRCSGSFDSPGGIWQNARRSGLSCFTCSAYSRYVRISRVICAGLSPAIFPLHARTNPRSFLLSRANSCATTTRSVQAYVCVRPYPANSIPALDSRNSRTCSWLKCPEFCIFNLHWAAAWRSRHPSFMLILRGTILSRGRVGLACYT
jgi:hypothetical protein